MMLGLNYLKKERWPLRGVQKHESYGKVKMTHRE